MQALAFAQRACHAEGIRCRSSEPQTRSCLQRLTENDGENECCLSCPCGVHTEAWDKGNPGDGVQQHQPAYPQEWRQRHIQHHHNARAGGHRNCVLWGGGCGPCRPACSSQLLDVCQGSGASLVCQPHACAQAACPLHLCCSVLFAPLLQHPLYTRADLPSCLAPLPTLPTHSPARLLACLCQGKACNSEGLTHQARMQACTHTLPGAAHMSCACSMRAQPRPLSHPAPSQAIVERSDSGVAAPRKGPVLRCVHTHVHV